MVVPGTFSVRFLPTGASDTTIRYLSTAHSIAPYAISVLHTTQHPLLSQYCTPRGTIRYLSTAHPIAPYIMQVPDIT
eukprot:2402320-Rhodomonas_salina.1